MEICDCYRPCPHFPHSDMSTGEWCCRCGGSTAAATPSAAYREAYVESLRTMLGAENVTAQTPFDGVRIRERPKRRGSIAGMR